MREYFVWLAKVVTIIILVVVVIPIIIGSIAVVSSGVIQEVSGPTPVGGRTVAVVELTGMLESGRDVIDELYRQASNPRAKGIVLRIDSPGGAVGPSQEIYEAVKKLKSKKPIVASMGSVAASGGLYSALGASKIFAQPGTLTGSIGVVLQIPNLSKIAEWARFEMVTVKSGELKDTGNVFREMKPEERAFLDQTTAEIHQQFMAAVSESRSIPMEQVRQFADGRVILGSQAKELSLIDGFGDVYTAARAVFEVLGEPLGDDEYPTLFYPADKFPELRRLIHAALDLPSVFSSQTPVIRLQ